VGHVETNTVAYAGGLRPGDTVLEANGHSIRDWNELVQVCSLGETVDLRVRRPDGSVAAMVLTTTMRANVFEIRMLEGVEQGSVCKVGLVAAGSMAEQAGLLPGDIIKTFHGVIVAGRGHLIVLVQSREGQATTMTVERNGETLELNVTPVLDPEHRMVRIGIVFDAMVQTPLEQIQRDATGVLRFLKALVTPRQAGHAAKSVGGPVSIFVAFWLYAKAGLLLVLGFARFLNVNLAILNLLPIPVLDGGHILFSLYEGIFRRPVGERVVNALINAFAALLIGLMVFLSFRDLKIWNRFSGLLRESARAEAPAEPGVTEPQPEPIP